MRLATESDLPELTRLYNELGVATTASYDLAEVDEANRAHWLARHHVVVAEPLANEKTSGLAGYAAYGNFRSLAGYDATAETSIYVDPACQGRGLAKQLMTALIDDARADGLHALVAVIDAENETSRRLHESLGFVEQGLLREVGRKFDRWLDVVLSVLIVD